MQQRHCYPLLPGNDKTNFIDHEQWEKMVITEKPDVMIIGSDNLRTELEFDSIWVHPGMMVKG